MDNTERLANRLTEFFEKFSSWEHGVVRGTGLTLPQMHTLETLGAHGPMRMKELAARMGVTTGTLTVLADRLQDKALVERRPHETDRRSIVIGLTPEGEERFAEHHRLHLRLTEEISADMTQQEADQLCDLLERMGNRI